MGKGQSFLIHGVGKTEDPRAKKKEKNNHKPKNKTRLDDYFTIFTKLNSKFMKDLKITPETIKILKQNIYGNLLEIGIDAECRGNKAY